VTKVNRVSLKSSVFRQNHTDFQLLILPVQLANSHLHIPKGPKKKPQSDESSQMLESKKGVRVLVFLWTVIMRLGDRRRRRRRRALLLPPLLYAVVCLLS